MVGILDLNRKRTGFRIIQASVLFVSVCWTGLTFGQSAQSNGDDGKRAAAEALFDEAKSLMVQRKYAEACPKFQASQALDSAVGTRLNLADCLEKLGRTASAWAEFRAAASAAQAKGQMDRVDVARKRAAALERELVKLSIVAPPGPHDHLEILKNGSAVPKASWGTALPVDPGHYVIVARLSNKDAYQVEVDVPNKSGTVITAVIPPLDEAALAKRQWYRAFTLTMGAASVTSLVIGGALGLHALSQNAESTRHCIAKNICDQQGVSLRQDALTYGNASTAALLIGTGFGLGAILFHVTSPPRTPPTKIGIGAMHSGVGLVVGGTF